MNTEQLFQELGISPIFAVTLMENLDLSPEHLSDPHTFARLQGVIEFLKSYPEDTQRFIIRKSTIGKQDKLKVLHEYTSLLKEKSFYEGIADKIKQEKSAVELGDDFLKRQEVVEKEIQNNVKLNSLRDEIELYHK